MTAEHEERVARAKARVGSVLNGKYRLDRVLGVGGMAAVYSATHLRNASRVAVKVLHPQMAADSNVRARFLREGYAANSVEHPGTVRILDDDTAEDGSVFLVMELLVGETLDHRWERAGHRLGAREVARLVYQVLDVLGAAHAKGIVHRDIKPENLFLTRGGQVKVLDFGVARLIEGPVTATRPGGIIGTPAFMAPEQVLGKAVDPQSDIYSVGATAFALLSKRYVHEAENAGEMMVIVGSRPARSLANVCPELPALLSGVIDRSLRFNKEERWPDARSMQVALAHAYRDAFGAPMPGAEDVEEETSVTIPPGAGPGEARSSKASERAAAAVTVLTGATPVLTQVVERPQGWRPASLHLLRSHMVAAVGGGLTLVVGIAIAIAASSQPSRPAAPPTAQPAAVPAAHTTELSSAWSAADPAPLKGADPPSFNVESLPAVQAAAPASAASPAPAPVVPVHIVPPRPAPSCSPPYTVDSTGKKKWKLECL